MTRIKLDFLYYESKVVYALSKLFTNIAYKFMDRHHEIYLKYHKLTKEVDNDERSKALEQESCEDLVSRQAVLNLFNKSSDYSWEMSLLKRKIEKMPPLNKREVEE